MADAISSTAHQAFMLSGTLLWGLYESSGAARVAAMVVPEHTRNALFSLFVGLRAENSPKDADFFKIHAEALQPRSFLGWLAMGACLLCASSWAAAAAAVSLCLSLAALNVLLFVSVIGGATLGFVLGCASVCLFVSAFVAGCTAFGCAIAYSTLASTKAIVQTAQRVLLGPAEGAGLHLAAPRQVLEAGQTQSPPLAVSSDTAEKVEDAKTTLPIAHTHSAALPADSAATPAVEVGPHPASEIADTKRVRNDADWGAKSKLSNFSAASPSKKKRRSWGESEASPGPHSGSNASDLSPVPDLLDLMRDGFVGSPEGPSSVPSRAAEVPVMAKIVAV